MNDYKQQYKGSFTSAMRWEQLDVLWQTLIAQDRAWYVVAIGEALPEQPLSGEPLHKVIDELDSLLRDEHEEDYCGIVYADNLQSPSMIKVYDPNNLGVSCGYSDNPPPPGWVLSHLKPQDLNADIVLPNNRKRWWQRIFS